MAKDTNRLTRIQYVRVADWITKNLAELKAEGTTYITAAEMCSRQLELSISDAGISRFAKDLELDWNPPSAASGKSKSVKRLEEGQEETKNQIVRLMQAAANQGADIANLRGAISFLADRLGETLPPRFGIVQTAKPTITTK